MCENRQLYRVPNTDSIFLDSKSIQNQNSIFVFEIFLK